MGFHKPNRIAKLTVEHGEKKAKLPLSTVFVLGFLGGAFISIGYLLDIRVTANLPEEWGTLNFTDWCSCFSYRSYPNYYCWRRITDRKYDGCLDGLSIKKGFNGKTAL